MISPEKRRELIEAATMAGHGTDEILKWLGDTYGLGGTREIPVSMFAEIKTRLSLPVPLEEEDWAEHAQIDDEHEPKQPK